MGIEQTVYAITRMLNKASRTMTIFDAKRYIEKKVADLTDEEKQLLVRVLKAMGMLVSGDEMEVLRDPSKFDEWSKEPNFGMTWHHVLSTKAKYAIKAADPSFDEDIKPTKEDYVMANEILKVMGSSSVSSDVVAQYDDLPPDKSELSGGFETLYRGLSKVSDRIIRRVAIKKPWSIKHGVSTSYDKGSAMNFCGLQSDGTSANQGPAVFFTINNPEKKGFIADELSDFGEQEVILSGDFQINKWILSSNGRMGARYYDQAKDREVQRGIRTLMQANSETMEIKFIYKEHFKKVDYLSFTDQQKFLDAVDKYAFNQGTFETDKLGMPGNVSKWHPNRLTVLIAADVTLI